MAHLTNVKYELKNTDVDGFKMPFKRFDGYDENFWSLLPDNIGEHLQGLKDAEVRPDDIFICTYPRSGTNWTNEIVRMLINGNDNYIDYFLDYFDMLPNDKLAEMKSPRIFVSHFPLRFLPNQLSEKGKVICVFRNPKDVAASFFNWTRDINFAEFDGNFSDYLKLFFNGDVPSGSWFEHVTSWESVVQNKSAKSLLLLYYEDMKKDLRSSVEKIADFIGVQYNGELFEKITTQCGFKNMAKEKKAHVPEVIVNLSKDKSNYIYRRGQVGDWKNWFTVAQNEQFDSIYEERMKNSKLSFTYC